MARPRKEIDWKLFESLCEIQCTQEEIANIMRLNQDTVRDRARDKYGKEDYSEIYKTFSAGGKMSLRRYQFNLAKTNAAMAIWLGKQWLGQKDEITTNHTIADSIEEFKAEGINLEEIDDV